MKDLVISGKSVRLTDGLYSLNDLHKAAGGEDKHKPANWLALQQTEALIAAIVDAGFPASEGNQILTKDDVIRVVKGGSSAQGTYVCKELVYAYAMWISPVFNLHVIRAFDGVVAKNIRPVDDLDIPARSFKSLYEMLRAMELDRNAAAIGANGAIIRASGINLLELTGQTKLISETQKNWYTPTELSKMLEPGCKPTKINTYLAAAGLQTKNPATGKWELTEEGQKYGRVTEVTPVHGGKMRPQILWAHEVLEMIEPLIAEDS